MTSWYQKLTAGLRKTSESLGTVFTHRTLDASTLEALEETLILADMGLPTAQAIVSDLSKDRVDKTLTDEEIRALLASAIAARLSPYALPLPLNASPTVVLVVGVNGNGKTTTIGKLAHQLSRQGKKIVVAAADTFRAAAVEQLEQWANRSGSSFVRGAENADPAAVAYAGVERALKEQADVVFIDTAGRLHTKENLMAELAKIRKAIGKLLPEAPHVVLQVLDATTGQNALAQVKAFREVAGVSGLIVTKLDGTAKAGIVVALADQFKLPIYAIGVGEGAEDLQPFDAQEFTRAMVGLSI